MHSNTLKKYWPIVVLLSFSILIAACQTTAATEAPAPTAAPVETEEMASEEIELTFWMIGIGDAFDTWWQNYIDEYEAAHPNVTISYETFESEAYKTKISSAVIAGTAPDLYYQIPGPETAVWYDEGKLFILDQVLDPSRFVPSARDGCSDSGDLVCVPMYLAPSFIYYNKAMFAEAGVDPQTWGDPSKPTWDEFLAASDALKAAGQIPIALGNADNWPGLFYYWAIQNRYGGLTEFNSAVDGSGSFTDPSFLKAGELVQELNDRGYLPEGFNGIAGDQKYSLFTQGVGAMIYMGPWMLGSISGDAPEGFEFGIFHFPSFPDGDPDSQTDLMTGIDAIWVNADSPNAEAAAEFLTGFYDPDKALSFMLDTENVSSVVGVVEAAQASGADAPILLLAEAASSAAHVYPWWDWALPPAVSEEMLNMAQGLYISEISPEEFGQNLEAAR